MKKTWNILIKSSLSLLTVFVLGAVSLVLVSLLNTETIMYGDRCRATLNETAIDYLQDIKEIDSYDYNLSCNTLYLDMMVSENIDEGEATTILVSVSYFYKSIDYQPNVQVSLKGSNYILLATFTKEGGVSVTSSLI